MIRLQSRTSCLALNHYKPEEYARGPWSEYSYVLSSSSLSDIIDYHKTLSLSPSSALLPPLPSFLMSFSEFHPQNRKAISVRMHFLLRVAFSLCGPPLSVVLMQYLLFLFLLLFFVYYFIILLFYYFIILLFYYFIILLFYYFSILLYYIIKLHCYILYFIF